MSRLVLQKLHGGRVVADIGAGGHGLLGDGVQQLVELVVAGGHVVVDVPAVGVARSQHDRGEVRRLANDVVDHLAGAVQEGLDHLVVVAAVGQVGELEVDIGQVVGLTGVEEHLGVEGGHAPAVGDDLVELLQHDDLGAALGSGHGRGGAGRAEAHDADLGVDGLDDLVVGDGLGLGLPTPAGTGGCSALARLAQRLLRRARSATGHAGCGGATQSDGGSGQEIAARDALVHDGFLSWLPRPPRIGGERPSSPCESRPPRAFPRGFSVRQRLRTLPSRLRRVILFPGQRGGRFSRPSTPFAKKRGDIVSDGFFGSLSRL